MEVQRNVPLKKHTTFQIGGPANYFLAARNKEELIEALNFAKEKGVAPLIIGGGSNLLISDKGYGGVAIKVQNAEIEIEGENVLAGAGLLLSSLVKRSFEKNLSGMEWAAGIPGTVGGAVAGNAGAFNGEMADLVERVEAYDIEAGKIVEMTREECRFGYRSSIFKNNSNLVILSAALKLEEGSGDNILQKIEANLQYRREKHPKEPSAGSCFKNISIEELPEDFFDKFPETKESVRNGILPAAFLIHSCGLKGEKIGSAQVSPVHPNFIVNLNGASAGDVLELISFVKKKIEEKYGLKLQEEIKILDNNS